jgi:signal-transduction protein with cAMP-binding, CBS, and nucleotidyltransferase domain
MEAVVVKSYYSIVEVAKMMKKHAIGDVVVVDDNENIVGIVTAKDIINKVVADGKGYDVRVKDIMSPNPIIIDENAEIKEAFILMSVNKIRRIPVVSNGRLVGILSIKDLMDYLWENKICIVEKIRTIRELLKKRCSLSSQTSTSS